MSARGEAPGGEPRAGAGGVPASPDSLSSGGSSAAALGGAGATIPARSGANSPIFGELQQARQPEPQQEQPQPEQEEISFPRCFACVREGVECDCQRPCARCAAGGSNCVGSEIIGAQVAKGRAVVISNSTTSGSSVNSAMAFSKSPSTDGGDAVSPQRLRESDGALTSGVTSASASASASALASSSAISAEVSGLACPFPGCRSVFRGAAQNRPMILRRHLQSLHKVDPKLWMPPQAKRAGAPDKGALSGRPSKRRRTKNGAVASLNSKTDGQAAAAAAAVTSTPANSSVGDGGGSGSTKSARSSSAAAPEALSISPDKEVPTDSHKKGSGKGSAKLGRPTSGVCAHKACRQALQKHTSGISTAPRYFCSVDHYLEACADIDEAPIKCRNAALCDGWAPQVVFRALSDSKTCRRGVCVECYNSGQAVARRTRQPGTSDLDPPRTLDKPLVSATAEEASLLLDMASSEPEVLDSRKEIGSTSNGLHASNANALPGHEEQPVFGGSQSLSQTAPRDRVAPGDAVEQDDSGHSEPAPVSSESSAADDGSKSDSVVLGERGADLSPRALTDEQQELGPESGADSAAPAMVASAKSKSDDGVQMSKARKSPTAKSSMLLEESQRRRFEAENRVLLDRLEIASIGDLAIPNFVEPPPVTEAAAPPRPVRADFGSDAEFNVMTNRWRQKIFRERKKHKRLTENREAVIVLAQNMELRRRLKVEPGEVVPIPETEVDESSASDEAPALNPSNESGLRGSSNGPAVGSPSSEVKSVLVKEEQTSVDVDDPSMAWCEFCREFVSRRQGGEGDRKDFVLHDYVDLGGPDVAYGVPHSCPVADALWQVGNASDVPPSTDARLIARIFEKSGFFSPWHHSETMVRHLVGVEVPLEDLTPAQPPEDQMPSAMGTSNAKSAGTDVEMEGDDDSLGSRGGDEGESLDAVEADAGDLEGSNVGADTDMTEVGTHKQLDKWPLEMRKVYKIGNKYSHPFLQFAGSYLNRFGLEPGTKLSERFEKDAKIGRQVIRLQIDLEGKRQVIGNLTVPRICLSGKYLNAMFHNVSHFVVDFKRESPEVSPVVLIYPQMPQGEASQGSKISQKFQAAPRSEIQVVVPDGNLAVPAPSRKFTEVASNGGESCFYACAREEFAPAPGQELVVEFSCFGYYVMFGAVSLSAMDTKLPGFEMLGTLGTDGWTRYQADRFTGPGLYASSFGPSSSMADSGRLSLDYSSSERGLLSVTRASDSGEDDRVVITDNLPPGCVPFVGVYKARCVITSVRLEDSLSRESTPFPGFSEPNFFSASDSFGVQKGRGELLADNSMLRNQGNKALSMSCARGNLTPAAGQTLIVDVRSTLAGSGELVFGAVSAKVALAGLKLLASKCAADASLNEGSKAPPVRKTQRRSFSVDSGFLTSFHVTGAHSDAAISLHLTFAFRRLGLLRVSFSDGDGEGEWFTVSEEILPGSVPFFGVMNGRVAVAKAKLSGSSEAFAPLEVTEERMRAMTPDRKQTAPASRERPARIISWTTELHAKFVEAFDKLGASNGVQTPSTILAEMTLAYPGDPAISELTKRHVASHLQQHRLHLNKAKMRKEEGQSAQNLGTDLKMSHDSDTARDDSGVSSHALVADDASGLRQRAVKSIDGPDNAIAVELDEKEPSARAGQLGLIGAGVDEEGDAEMASAPPPPQGRATKRSRQAARTDARMRG